MTRFDDISVWLLRLNRPPAVVRGLRRLLSEEELNSVNRLHRVAHRNERIVARAGLRRLLGEALEVDPAELRLTRDARGRPCLDRRRHRVEVDFNLSHSRGLGLVAIAQGVTVGVDIEAIARHRDPGRLANLYFSRAEAAFLMGFQGCERQLQFCRMFTAKEAVAKATGLGLRLPLSRIRLDLDATSVRAGTALTRAGDSRWQLRGLPAPSGYAATLAMSSAAPVSLKF